MHVSFSVFQDKYSPSAMLKITSIVEDVSGLGKDWSITPMNRSKGGHQERTTPYEKTAARAVTPERCSNRFSEIIYTPPAETALTLEATGNINKVVYRSSVRRRTNPGAFALGTSTGILGPNSESSKCSRSTLCRYGESPNPPTSKIACIKVSSKNAGVHTFEQLTRALLPSES